MVQDTLFHKEIMCSVYKTEPLEANFFEKYLFGKFLLYVIWAIFPK